MAEALQAYPDKGMSSPVWNLSSFSGTQSKTAAAKCTLASTFLTLISIDYNVSYPIIEPGSSSRASRSPTRYGSRGNPARRLLKNISTVWQGSCVSLANHSTLTKQQELFHILEALRYSCKTALENDRVRIGSLYL